MNQAGLFPNAVTVPGTVEEHVGVARLVVEQDDVIAEQQSALASAQRYLERLKAMEPPAGIDTALWDIQHALRASDFTRERARRIVARYGRVAP